MFKNLLSFSLSFLFLSFSFAASIESCELDTPPQVSNFRTNSYEYQDINHLQILSNSLYDANYSPRTCDNLNLANKIIDVSILSIAFAETVCLVSPEPVSKPVAVTMHVSGMLLAEIKFLVQMGVDECSKNEILSQARKENEQLIKTTVIQYLEQQGAQVRGVQ